jgi:hypothetical protein
VATPPGSSWRIPAASCPIRARCRARWLAPGALATAHYLRFRQVAERLGDLLLPLVAAVQIDQRGAGRGVAHAVHQLPQRRPRRRCAAPGPTPALGLCLGRPGQRASAQLQLGADHPGSVGRESALRGGVFLGESLSRSRPPCLGRPPGVACDRPQAAEAGQQDQGAVSLIDRVGQCEDLGDGLGFRVPGSRRAARALAPGAR